MENQKFNLSESFYSVQCEGISSGVPAYFVRLPGCNLLCGNPCGGLKGDITKPGENATWVCDSIPVWSKHKEVDFQYLVDDWRNNNILEWILDGRVHIVWTGGEPLTPKNKTVIEQFISWFKQERFSNIDFNPYYEVETNGTMPLSQELSENIHQINCSVKLRNSGMPESRRIKPEALESIINHPGHWFKFVVSNEQDMDEIEEDFIIPFNIDPKRIILMPGLDKQKNFHERTRFTLEMAKKYGYIGLSRLHISAWDQLTGV